MSFRVNPYLQQPSSEGMHFTWFTEEDTSGEITITGPGLDNPLSFNTDPTFESVLSYTNAELNQEIDGLEQGSWLLGDENYKHTVDVSGLLPDRTYQYTVTVGDEVFEASFQTAPTQDNWDQIRFFALSDSETEPRGRVRRRDWQQGALDSESEDRPALEGSQWADTLGVSGDRLNYPLTENVGYRNNLEIINSREPDFMMMPGDLVQGGGYQPGWDEFFRHNAGEFDSGLSEYPILPALGNWENFGALNGGYGTDDDGRFGPKFGHDKFHAYFDAPPNGTPEHQDNYYRIDYGPITVLTLDTSNGEPDDSRDNYGGEGQPPKISGREFTEPGTDTQQNYTREQYEAAGGTDLADFNPGSPQWNWAIEQLEDAREQGQIIFAQFHHVPYSSGTHGLPMNHEDSSGQGGTPMRQYHPLFEEYEVAAVFSGHSEMFERSFVDEDGDGIGVHYYDVGVAGDGMRGERTDEEGNLLSYNQFSQWTADQSEPELWEEVNGVLQNVAGGKHYGHLEVNLQQTDEGAEITLTPVYSFPTLDSDYNLVDTERRVYGDEITLQTNADGTLQGAISGSGSPAFGSLQDDTLEAGINFDGEGNLVFSGEGNDSIEASTGNGGNRLYGGSNNDELVVGSNDRAFGGAGNDIIESSLGRENRLYGGAGNDTVIAGYEDRIMGGDGNDRLFLSEGQVEGGGKNLVTGGAGADQFWIANAQIAANANEITDFIFGEDVLGIGGIDSVAEFADLSLTQDGADAIVSVGDNDVARLLGVNADELTADNFAIQATTEVA
ncbi:UNVERIFIED_CONTAM: metallophosphoesterase [Euhalothece sp. KZN 001]